MQMQTRGSACDRLLVSELSCGIYKRRHFAHIRLKKYEGDLKEKKNELKNQPK